MTHRITAKLPRTDKAKESFLLLSSSAFFYPCGVALRVLEAVL